MGEVLVGVPHDMGTGKVPIDVGALYNLTTLALLGAIIFAGSEMALPFYLDSSN